MPNIYNPGSHAVHKSHEVKNLVLSHITRRHEFGTVSHHKKTGIWYFLTSQEDRSLVLSHITRRTGFWYFLTSQEDRNLVLFHIPRRQELVFSHISSMHNPAMYIVHLFLSKTYQNTWHRNCAKNKTSAHPCYKYIFPLRLTCLELFPVLNLTRD